MLNAWYKGAWWLYLLWPLSLLFRLLSRIRRVLLQRALKKRAPVTKLPVVVVGNITLGGTGKTPVVIALSNALKKAGYRPGIVSRGYGGRAPQYPFQVRADSDPAEAGDEAVVISRSTGCPVMVDPVRSRAVKALSHQGCCDVIISDDGLQHYAMHRDIEVLVIDGERQLGNRLCLPAGPLREPPARMGEVDYLVVNGPLSDFLEGEPGVQDKPRSVLQLEPRHWRNLKSGQLLPLEGLRGTGQTDSPELAAVPEPHSGFAAADGHAVAAIGNPQRFFSLLRKLGYQPQCHPFADHHQYQAADLAFDKRLPLMMTEKDAVKCEKLAHDNCWCLVVEPVLDQGFIGQLLDQLQALTTVPVQPGPAAGEKIMSE